jgi:diketogulonate reductase-like aldo/keto reductase
MRRRALLCALPALAVATATPAQPGPLTRPIPSSGETVPTIGLGTWITFNVGRDPPARAQRVQVMQAFFDAGGRVIDSSPMYGSSQGVIGEGLQRLGAQARVFAADKVWTSGDGPAQIEASRAHWQVPRFDLLQVHNLVAWEKQLALLQSMKAQGQVRYVGITTSEGRRHDEIERLLKTQRLDFVQFTYNLVDREVEQRLLPLARDRGVAVLANRPFQEGAMLRRLQRHAVPAWASEIGCRHWAQVALKFIVSHPDVTCVIPATSRVDHLQQNMAAALGPQPDAALRRRMAEHVAAL